MRERECSERALHDDAHTSCAHLHAPTRRVTGVDSRARASEGGAPSTRRAEKHLNKYRRKHTSERDNGEL